MVDDASVANPLRAELEDLLRQARRARGSVPSMRGPLEAVGDGQAWRSPAARRFRDNHLQPVSSTLYSQLDRALEDIEAARDAQPSMVSPERADALRARYGLR